MDKLNKYLLREDHHQKVERQREVDKLTAAIKYLWINIGIYILITVVEYWLSVIGDSVALRADALNNLSGVISTGVLIIGLREATNINDDDIIGRDLPAKSVRSQDSMQLSRFRLETVFTLITSFIIVLIGLQIIVTGGTGLFHLKGKAAPNLISALGAGIATVMMFGVYYINHHYGKKLGNGSLLAASKDSLGDVVTSLGTMITVLVSYALHLAWIDSAVSIVIGVFILWQGIQIFQESTLNLADYVDPVLELQMKEAAEKFKKVHRVVDLRSRYNGNILLVDMFIMVDPKATAMEIYSTNEKIERKLHKDFNVFDVTITIIPDPESLK
ncbi:cation diffusion facilitator family transporter [Companilactobacillus ginsenosidimutans]|uniref:Cobalt transporter n=1 Tax=Companilactobacillus ginsenosidimutans TaxID=1007676 RepID=A0A0H4QJH5_9LACO|nr:cation diffusion facilitator family transporter [Companilactobacillus ginsenosidimutans]AKP67191.1 cobalt transporter [Companilactobacillus ginsenosidimutans]